MLVKGLLFLLLMFNFCVAQSGYIDAKYKNAERAFEAYNGSGSEQKSNSEPSPALNSSGNSPMVQALPSILVMPVQSKAGLSEFEIIQKNPQSRMVLDAVSKGLSSKGYDIRSIEAKKELDNLVLVQNAIAGTEQDLAYMASLSVGADVYVKYAGETSMKSVKVSLSAYDAITGRLLGSEVAENKIGNAAERDACIRKTAEDAARKLEPEIQKYWNLERSKGSQYKVVLNITGEFEENFIEDLHMAISGALKKLFSSFNINVMTDKTVDVTVLANSATYGNSQEVYAAIRKELKNVVDVKKNNITKKLIILELK